MTYRVLSLFAGIGGFDLGLERTGGFETVAFCEIDPFCRRVLAKHWPGVPCYHDVRELTAERLVADGIAPNFIVGGFPCQDLSLAGSGAGLGGDRSGLWFEYHRLISEIAPAAAIIENVSALRSRGLDAVLRGLDAVGYDAEWHCIPAAAVGAPHRRDRVWIVATRREGMADSEGVSGRPGLCEARTVSNGNVPSNCRGHLADGCGPGLEGHSRNGADRTRWAGPHGPVGSACLRQREHVARWWRTEPDVGRVAHGVPDRVDRLKSLGNAVVPQIPELIGHTFLGAEVA